MLSIHVGQFGNQVGLEFWSQLLCIPETEPNAKLSMDQRNSIASWLEVRDSFLHDDGTARIVAVDSEPRVIANAYTLLHTACADIYSGARNSRIFHEIPSLSQKQQHARFSCDSNLHSLTSPTFDDYSAQKRQKTKRSQPLKALPSTCSFQYMQNGCGNNWALGYYGDADQGRHPLLTSILKAVQYHIDKMQGRVDGVLLFHSLAGGTGSGLGSRQAVELRKLQGPDTLIMSICGSPLKTGEVVLQHYNSVCTVAAQYDSVDAVWMCPSEDAIGLSKDCVSAAEGQSTRYQNDSSSKNQYRVFGPLNSYLCSTLIDFLAPQAVTTSAEPVQSNHVQVQQVRKYVDSTLADIEKELQFTDYSSRVITFYPRTATQLRQRQSQLALGPLKFVDLWSCCSRSDIDKSLNRIPNRQVDSSRKCVFTVQDSPFDVTPLFERIHPMVSYHLRVCSHSGLHSFSSALKHTLLPLRMLTARKDVQWSERTLFCTNSGKQADLLHHHMERMRTMLHVGAYTHWFVKHGCSLTELASMLRFCEFIYSEYIRFTK